MTLRGIDISVYQSTTPSLTGLDFVFCRATYTTTPDAMYATHSRNVLAAGKVLGAYHFGTARAGIAAQVSAFLSAAANTELLALDLESDAFPMDNTMARQFIAAVQAKGHHIGLYHSESGYPSDALGADFRWVAKWGGIVPSIPYSFWQYQGSPLDSDYFAGDLAALHAIAGLNPPDTSTGGTVSVITVTTVPFGGGTFTVPAGTTVTGIKLDSTGAVALRVPFTAGASASTAHYDALVDLSGVGIRGNPQVRVTDGALAGCYLSSAGLTLTPNPDPSPFAQADLDTSYNHGYADGKTAGLAAGTKQGWNDARSAAISAVTALPSR